MPGPLAHLTVLDLTDLRGALAGRLLADLGADVIKIEPPGGDAEPPAAAVRRQRRRAGSLAAVPLSPREQARRGDRPARSRAAGARFAALCDAADVLHRKLRARPARQVLGLAPGRCASAIRSSCTSAIADFGLERPARRLAARAAAGFRRVRGALRLGLPRPPAVLAARLRRARLRGGVRRAPARSRPCSTAPGTDAARRSRCRCRRPRSAGFNPWSIPLADYQRALPDVADRAAAQRRRQLLVLPRAMVTCACCRPATPLARLRRAARRAEALRRRRSGTLALSG